MNDSRLLAQALLRHLDGCRVVFGGLLIGFAIQAPALDVGGRWHLLIWDRVTDPVAPMLLAVCVVWSIFIIRAARDPMANTMFSTSPPGPISRTASQWCRTR
jgi:hypothetical protein